METLLLTEKSQNTERREGGTGAVPGWYSQSPGLLPQVQEEEEDKREKGTRGKVRKLKKSK